MLRRQLLVLLVLIGWLAGGCGVVPRSSYPPSRTVPRDTTQKTASVSSDEEAGPSGSETEDTNSRPPKAMTVSSINEVKVSLMQAYRDWKGTPYVLGGASQNGVDCSKFVEIVFDEYFGINLPTNTRTQLNAGDGIRRAGIQTGDLVFFRTGRKSLHVGIAVNHGEFLHASTSNGVMISKLGNSYWRNRFLAARRIL